MIVFIVSDYINRLNSTFESILVETKKRLVTEINEEAQYELAKIFNLLPYFFRYPSLEPHLNLIDASASSLLTDKPNIKLAKTIRIDLERRVHDKEDDSRYWLSYWRYVHNPCARVLTGAVCNILLSFIYGWFFYRLWVTNPDATIFGIQAYKIALVTIMGMFGSIVSIMLRIRDYEGQRGEYASSLFITGFTKPLIGAMFSLFMLTVISSGVLPLDYEIIEGTAFYFFAAISFITGFSERFARDVIAKTEEAIV